MFGRVRMVQAPRRFARCGAKAAAVAAAGREKRARATRYNQTGRILASAHAHACERRLPPSFPLLSFPPSPALLYVARCTTPALRRGFFRRCTAEILRFLGDFSAIVQFADPTSRGRVLNRVRYIRYKYLLPREFANNIHIYVYYGTYEFVT